MKKTGKSTVKIVWYGQGGELDSVMVSVSQQDIARRVLTRELMSLVSGAIVSQRHRPPVLADTGGRRGGRGGEPRADSGVRMTD